MSRSTSRLALSSSPVPDSASSQSTGSPSEIERVMTSSGSSALMTHGPRELAKRALHAHAGGIRARPVHHARDLLVDEFQLVPDVDEKLLIGEWLTQGVL